MYKVRPFRSHFFISGFLKRKLRVLFACRFLKLMTRCGCSTISFSGNRIFCFLMRKFLFGKLFVFGFFVIH